MKYPLTVVVFLVVPVILRAQCLVQGFSVSADCNSDGPVATGTLSGGQPPYSLQFTGSNGTWTIQQGVPDGAFSVIMGDFLYSVLTPPVDLLVTDANGCIATATTTFPEHALILAEVWFERACSAATSALFWSGTYYHSGSGVLAGGLPDPCAAGPYGFSILNALTGTLVSSGALTAHWTQQTNGFWRYNTTLAHGSYSVVIHPASDPFTCQSGAVTYCFRTKLAITDPSTDGCGQRFRLKAFLGGPLAPLAVSMRDSLRVKGLIPIAEPYSAQGYMYVGPSPGLAIAPSLLNISGSNALVDWVVVELRSSAAPFSVLHSMPALIQRDGDVVGVDGSTILRAPLGPGPMHVALRHRNHLGVMSAAPLWVNSTPLVAGGASVYDLRSPGLTTYGTSARQPNGAFLCLWPGEATGDGVVKYTGGANDRDAILTAIGGGTPTNTMNNVYDRRDVNLDGSIKYTGSNNDRDVILQTIGGTVPTATRTQQLP